MLSPVLRFEDEGHQYYLDYEDGTVESIPSVSDIIQPLVDYSRVDPDTMIRACEFGKNVHRAIELYLKGTLDGETLDEGLIKPLEGFQRWYDTDHLFLDKEYHAGCRSEERLYHLKLKYAGTIDLLVKGVAIVDYKTRKYDKIVDPVRLAAYRGMLPAFPPMQEFVLEIDTEGDTKLVNAYHKQAWGIFRKLLDYNKRKREMEILTQHWKGK